MNLPAGSVPAAPAIGYDIENTLRESGRLNNTEFEQFVKENEDGALRLAYSYLKDWDEARDAVQDGFVKAFRKMGGFRGEASRRTWFYRLMVNLLKDKLRRRKVRQIVSLVPFGFTSDKEEHPAFDPEDTAPGPASLGESSAVQRDFEEALDSLPARQRQVASLHLASGLTLKEASQSMGITEGAAKAHYFRAVRALREKLSAWREEQ